MNYAVIAASIKKTIIGRKTKSLIAALLLAASSTFAQVSTTNSTLLFDETKGFGGPWQINWSVVTGQNYILRVEGVYGITISSGIDADAAFGLLNQNPYNQPCSGYQDRWRLIDNCPARPNPDVYNPNHIYYYEINNSDGFINIDYSDGAYGDNSGSLNFQLYQNLQSCNSNTIIADGPTTFCAGNSVNLKSDVVGGTYQWRRNGVNISTNATSRTFKASLTGTYTCIATCNGTALTSNAIAVTSKTNAAATVSASGATSFCAGDSVILNCTNLGSNYSVQWYRTNISMENATNYSQVVKQPGTYKVVTKNLTTGCSRISGSAITTNVNCRIANNNQSEPTSNDINEEARTLAPELSHGVNLFPNPNNGSFKFTYEGEVEGEGTIQVISAMGQVIYQSQAIAEDGRISKEIFLGDQYQKGIYIVRLLINGGQNDSRMIVQ